MSRVVTFSYNPEASYYEAAFQINGETVNRKALTNVEYEALSAFYDFSILPFSITVEDLNISMEVIYFDTDKETSFEIMLSELNSISV